MQSESGVPVNTTPQLVPAAGGVEQPRQSSMLDLQVFYGKVRNDEPLAAGELAALLRELVHFRKSTAYLASCHAATVEGLTKSRGLKERSRHEDICRKAAQLLEGRSIDSWRLGGIDEARQRCLDAAASGSSKVPVS